LVNFRQSQPVLRHRHFLRGEPAAGSELPDIAWFRMDGTPMTDDDWRTGFAESLAMRLDGHSLDEVERAELEGRSADTLYLVFNAFGDTLRFTLPSQVWGRRWRVVLDSAEPDRSPTEMSAGEEVAVNARTVVVLRQSG
jgi:glycogen operon protein